MRYQPGNPQNSLVVAEAWSGLRAGLPQWRHFDHPAPMDTSHRKPGELARDDPGSSVVSQKKAP